MIRRGPVRPSVRDLVIATLAFALPMAVATMVWRSWTNSRWDPTTPLNALLIALVPMSLVLLGHFTLEAWRSHGWDSLRPQRRNWLIFYGTFVACGVLAGAIRSLLIGATAPPTLSHWRLAVDAALFGYQMALVAFFTERLAGLRHDIQRSIQANGQAVHRLFISQEALVNARDRGRHAAFEGIERRLAPALSGLERRLRSLQEQADGGRQLDLGTLRHVMDDLDRLRDEDIRQVSHLLHPSVINVSLLPALRSLAASSPVAVTMSTDDALRSLDHPAANRLPPSLRLTLYRIVEQALDDLARQEAPSPVRIRLTLADRAVSLEIHREAGPWDFKEKLAIEVIASRIEVAGGTWTLAPDDTGASVLRAIVPMPVSDSSGEIVPQEV